MKIHVVSDVHGAFADLAGAAKGADAFICLGDLLLYLDYDDPSHGAFAQIYGVDVARQYIALRLEKRFEEAREVTRLEWQRRYGNSGKDRMTMMMELVTEQYALLYPQLPADTYLTFGNVDVPAIGAPGLPKDVHYLDGATADIGDYRVGFVGGGLTSVYRTPNELNRTDYDAKVAALGPVDVLCSHIPPRVPDLMYDVVARRLEVGSDALLSYIRRHQPRYALFGHVHNPLASRFRIGRTECINVGHFRSTRKPFQLELV